MIHLLKRKEKRRELERDLDSIRNVRFKWDTWDMLAWRTIARVARWLWIHLPV
jgi:hypothetical protein